MKLFRGKRPAAVPRLPTSLDNSCLEPSQHRKESPSMAVSSKSLPGIILCSSVDINRGPAAGDDSSLHGGLPRLASH
ncbi:hypothetical protein V8C26DRAFT_397687 [Trichoderma gracile]